MKISRKTHLAVSAILAIGLTACGDKGVPTEASTTPAPASAEVPAVEPARVEQEMRVAEVKFGRYVEPATFKVGGIGRKFKQTDRIFASIALEGGMRTASLSVRMEDAQGGSVASGSREVDASSSPRVNIAVTGPGVALQPGSYRMVALLDGQVVDTQEVSVE